MELVQFFLHYRTRPQGAIIFPIKNIDPSLEHRLSLGIFFDHYRLIDIATYQVYDYHDGHLEPQDSICYQSWNHSRACNNCISHLAVRQNRPVVKLETLDRSIFLVVATPLKVDNRDFTLEFIKNVTDDLLISDVENEDNLTAIELVDRINELTVRQPTIGLLRKEYAERELEKLVSDWNGTDSVVLTVLDIDRFKQVNDEHGHLEGDGVLTGFSRLLLTYAQRGNGWGCRIGGDEFILTFSNLAEDEARSLINELQTDLASCTFGEKDPFSVTVSSGMAVLGSRHHTWRDLFSEADRAMYAAKQERRRTARN